MSVIAIAAVAAAAGILTGVGGTMFFEHRSRSDSAAEAVAEGAEASAHAAEAAATGAADAAEAAATGAASVADAVVAPDLEAERKARQAIEQDPARWLCAGDLADPIGCMTVVCWTMRVADTEAVDSCSKLVDAYIARMEDAP